MATDEPGLPATKGLWSSLGPAIITASVVLGPGSILSASKIGWQHGYGFIWVLAFAIVMMIGVTALSARLGVVLEGTLCDEIAIRAGRPFAALTGISLFLVASCFQFGNNLGVLAAIEPFYEKNPFVPVLVIVNLNVLIIVALFGFKSLYRPIERLMKFLVGLMLLGFAVNLVMARPDWLQVISGLIPRFPETAASSGQAEAPGSFADKLVPVIALFATTFSVGGAFYQSYLVRQKGWTTSDLRQGLFDSVVGICILGMLTAMIMITAAAVLHGNPDVKELNSATEVAVSLEPAFGRWAMVLFCMGIFAGAFSSFLANAMIGGSVLADGLGLGGYIDQPWPKLCTVLALMVGMNVAIYVTLSGQRPVNLIIFAQAMTVLAIPVLAGGMVFLASRPDLQDERRVPAWLQAFGWVALVIAIVLAIRTAINLGPQIIEAFNQFKSKA